MLCSKSIHLHRIKIDLLKYETFLVISNAWASGLASLSRHFNFRMDLGNLLYVCNKITIVNNVGYCLCQYFNAVLPGNLDHEEPPMSTVAPSLLLESIFLLWK